MTERSSIDPILLMQYYDGELSEAEAEAVEERLDDEARQVLAGLGQVGDIVRSLTHHAEERAPDMADDIMAQVAPLAEERARQTTAATPRSAPGAAQSWSFGSWRARSAVVGGALAAAAAVGLVVWAGAFHKNSAAHFSPPELGQPTGAAVSPTLSPKSRHATVADSSPVEGVSIEVVDFGARSGTIFMVTSENEAPTPVVWLVDEAPENQGRVEPL